MAFPGAATAAIMRADARARDGLDQGFAGSGKFGATLCELPQASQD